MQSGGTSQPLQPGPVYPERPGTPGARFIGAGLIIGLIGLVLWKGTTNPGTNGECVTFLLMLLGGALFVVGVITWAITKR